MAVAINETLDRGLPTIMFSVRANPEEDPAGGGGGEREQTGQGDDEDGPERKRDR